MYPLLQEERRKDRNMWGKLEIKSKMIDLNLSMEVIKLNVNNINFPIKRKMLDWMKNKTHLQTI